MSTKSHTINLRVTPELRKSLEAEAARLSKTFGLRITVSDVVRQHVEQAVLKRALNRRQIERLKGKTK